MRIPTAVLDQHGIPVLQNRNFVHVRRGSDQVPEYGYKEIGNTAECFIALAVGEKISVQFKFLRVPEQLVDLKVDGILRSTRIKDKAGFHHSDTFRRVYHCRRLQLFGPRWRGKIKHGEMTVQQRTTRHDIKVNADEHASDNIQYSEVGTIEVRVLRKDRPPLENASEELHESESAVFDRGPVFNQQTTWWEGNRRICHDPEYLPATMEIGFPDVTSTESTKQKKMNRELQGYSVWVTFKFHYRSASDLRAKGYDVPMEEATESGSGFGEEEEPDDEESIEVQTLSELSISRSTPNPLEKESAETGQQTAVDPVAEAAEETLENTSDPVDDVEIYRNAPGKPQEDGYLCHKEATVNHDEGTSSQDGLPIPDESTDVRCDKTQAAVPYALEERSQTLGYEEPDHSSLCPSPCQSPICDDAKQNPSSLLLSEVSGKSEIIISEPEQSELQNEQFRGETPWEPHNSFSQPEQDSSSKPTTTTTTHGLPSLQNSIGMSRFSPKPNISTSNLSFSSLESSISLPKLSSLPRTSQDRDFPQLEMALSIPPLEFSPNESKTLKAKGSLLPTVMEPKITSRQNLSHSLGQESQPLEIFQGSDTEIPQDKNNSPEMECSTEEQRSPHQMCSKPSSFFGLGIMHHFAHEISAEKQDLERKKVEMAKLENARVTTSMATQLPRHGIKGELDLQYSWFRQQETSRLVEDVFTTPLVQLQDPEEVKFSPKNLWRHGSFTNNEIRNINTYGRRPDKAFFDLSTPERSKSPATPTPTPSHLRISPTPTPNLSGQQGGNESVILITQPVARVNLPKRKADQISSNTPQGTSKISGLASEMNIGRNVIKKEETPTYTARSDSVASQKMENFTSNRVRFEEIAQRRAARQKALREIKSNVDALDKALAEKIAIREAIFAEEEAEIEKMEKEIARLHQVTREKQMMLLELDEY